MVPKLPWFIVAFLVTALLHSGVGQASSGNSTSTTTTTTTTTTTESPKTHSTTTKPTPTNATTTTPTTTTTSSTTTAPTPTTKPTPPPVFPKNLGDWSVVDPITNITCIHVTGAIEIHVSMKDSENKTVDFKVDVPASAKENGNCGKGDEQQLVLDWETKSDNAKNKIEFTFARNSTTNKYRLDHINGMVYVTPKNSTKEEEVEVNLENLDAHQLPLNKSYKCTSEETIKTKSANNVQIKLANIQMEAFRVSNTTGYSTPEECAADGYVADIVPIAVGCSLAGLVVIVLIAYLFGRRRARARGYQSV